MSSFYGKVLNTLKPLKGANGITVTEQKDGTILIDGKKILGTDEGQLNEAYDTLREVATWIQEDITGTADIINKIDALQKLAVITDAKINEDTGELVLYAADGSSITLGPVVGQDGEPGVKGDSGQDGVSISKSEINGKGELVITYSDNRVENLGKVVGADGAKGEKGDTGIQGEKGDQGPAYTLTDQDKQIIVDAVMDKLEIWAGGEY